MDYKQFPTYQEFEQPKTRLVIEGFCRIDEKQQHESIQDEWVCLHRKTSVLTIYTCQQAQAPQSPEESSNLD